MEGSDCGYYVPALLLSALRAISGHPLSCLMDTHKIMLNKSYVHDPDVKRPIKRCSLHLLYDSLFGGHSVGAATYL